MVAIRSERLSAAKIVSPPHSLVLGTALLAMAILMLQVTLIRIFSVTMWYHFAFMAISLALFGAAAGGVAVYLWPRLLPLQPRVSERRAALAALLAGLSLAPAIALHLNWPIGARGEMAWLMLALLYLDLAVPFFFGGLAMTLVLSAYPASMSRVYCADLLGAGAGCLLAIPLLNLVGGPGAVLGVASLMVAAALCLGTAGGWGRLPRVATAVIGLSLVGLMLANSSLGLLSIRQAKGRSQQNVVFEGWNSFSRITVSGDGDAGPGQPFTWALSSAYRGRDPGSRLLLIDGEAGTPIARFDGSNFGPLGYLRFDLSAIAYRLQGAATSPVLIIGPGGGRDILTARAFGRQSITAVEINPLIVTTVNERFGDYSGRPYSLPGVRTVIGDARSFLANAPDNERYGLIQATLIDTWASSSAGAFVLSENFLYTREAFADYYRHLTDDGMVTLSRWYFRDQPAEALRLLNLAQAAWQDQGLLNADQHLALVGIERPHDPMGLATLVAKRSPFTAEEIARLRSETSDLGFVILSAPGVSSDSEIGRLMRLPIEQRQAAINSYYLNVTPTTDDSPFFFNLLRPRDFLNTSGIIAGQAMPPNLQAVTTLVSLLMVVALLCLTTIIAPLAVVAWRRRRQRQATLRPDGLLYLGYAGCLGVGFMLVETVLMQRFILFLGQPVFALAVIVFTLLFFSGLGSGLSGRLDDRLLPTRQAAIIAGVVVASLLYALLLPAILRSLLGLPEWARVLASVGLLAPLGLLLGMPMPIGVRLANQRGHAALIPWAWAINGAASVLASVGAVTLALARGFTWVLLLATVCYLIAMALSAVPLLSARTARPRASGLVGET